ncbi:hypothetical protein LNP74_23305 [Klebsiella pneumoniae subsp. pneumoniae]|nr:hypothetical protein [Klebsiella pneumoniae subsp. pneumoniae]
MAVLRKRGNACYSLKTHQQGQKELFSILNGPDERYKAGSIMLLVDPEKQDDEQIAHMKAAKARVDAALEPLTIQEANLLHKHYANHS